MSRRRSDTLRPLSPTQEPIWLEQLRYPDRLNAGYLLVTLLGAVLADDIADACAAVSEYHPETRGLVEETSSGYGIRIRPGPEVFEFTRFTVPCARGTERDTSREWHAAQRAVAWDLTRRPPIRFTLLEHDAQRCTLVVWVHHIAFDGRSKFVFARHFVQALTRIRSGGRGNRTPVLGTPDPRPGPASIDADAVDQAVQHYGDTGLHRMRGLILPRADTVVPGGRAAPTENFELATNLGHQLRQIGRSVNGSFFAGLLASTSALLGDYGNDRTVLCISADTSTAATAEHIGMQVNMVPCVIDIAGARTFRELVGSATASLADVHRFRRIPFHLLVRQLRKRTGHDVGPEVLDQIALSYWRPSENLGGVPGLTLEWDFFAPNSTQSVQLTLQLRRLADQSSFGRLDYSTALFDRPTAEVFMASWMETVERCVTAPDELLRRPPAARRELPTDALPSVEPAGSAPTPYVQGHIAAADQIAGMLGNRSLWVCGYAPGTKEFAASVTRSRVRGDELWIPSPGAEDETLERLVAGGRRAVIDGDFGWLRRWAASKWSVAVTGQIAVLCPADQFLPTASVSRLVRAGNDVVITLDDPLVGPVAWTRWRPGADDRSYEALLMDEVAAGLQPTVLTADGREVARKTPGIVALRRDDDPRIAVVTGFGGHLDGAGRLWLSEPVAVADSAHAERRVAAVRGIHEVAVGACQDGEAHFSYVVVAPDNWPEARRDARAWRRRVRRAWPAGAPAPVHVFLMESLPRTPGGRVDRRRLNEYVRREVLQPSTPRSEP